MKKWIGSITAILVGAAVAAFAMSVVYSGNLVNETALAYNNQYTLPLSGLNGDQVSATAVISSATVAAVTFTDGNASTGTITVVSTAPLSGVKGSVTLTIVSNTLPVGAGITIDGSKIVADGGWLRGSVSSATAVNIAKGINRYLTSQVAVVASTTSSTTVLIQCQSVGTFCNSKTISVDSSSMTVSSAKLTGGQNHATVKINGTTLTEGNEWTSSGTVTLTAGSISNAIINSAALSPLIVSTNVAGVVWATGTVTNSANNYIWTSSTPTALTVSGPNMAGGAASKIVNASHQIAVTGHGLTTALPVLFTKTAGTTPVTLAAGTTYYPIIIDSGHFQLASSQANALAGTALAITTGTVNGGGTFVLTPLAIAGTPSFKWQASEDGSHWVDLSVSSVTALSYTNGGAVTGWDFGRVNYDNMRVNVIGPTQGGINLVVRVNVRNNTR